MASVPHPLHHEISAAAAAALDDFTMPYLEAGLHLSNPYTSSLPPTAAGMSDNSVSLYIFKFSIS